MAYIARKLELLSKVSFDKLVRACWESDTTAATQPLRPGGPWDISRWRQPPDPPQIHQPRQGRRIRTDACRGHVPECSRRGGGGEKRGMGDGRAAPAGAHALSRDSGGWRHRLISERPSGPSPLAPPHRLSQQTLAGESREISAMLEGLRRALLAKSRTKQKRARRKHLKLKS
jgi:hypothetical protein